MSEKKKYKHIFFDLDNTLWDFKKNSRLAMFSTFSFFQIKQIQFGQFYEVYEKHNNQAWNDYREKKVSKKELIVSRFQKTFDELGINDIDPLLMNTHYLNEMPKQKELVEGALNLLEKLAAKGLKLYIITNGFKEVQHKKLESSGIKKYFKRIYISEEVKTPKPGKEIFEYAIKSSNAKKTQSLMVGDDYEVDVMGAIHFGIDAVYYSKQNEAVKQRDGKFCIFQVNDLVQIEKLL